MTERADDSSLLYCSMQQDKNLDGSGCICVYVCFNFTCKTLYIYSLINVFGVAVLIKPLKEGNIYITNISKHICHKEGKDQD